MRERRFNIIVGSPGSGKSTFTSNIIKTVNDNVIVYKHLANIDDPAFSFLSVKTQSSWRQGAAPNAVVKCKFAGRQENYADFLKWVISDFRNGMIVVDDATLFEKDRLSKGMNELVTMRRHYGIDIFLIYHGLTALPIDQFPFLNNVILFNTNDNFKYKNNKLPYMNDLTNAVHQARQNYLNPKTKYNPEIVRLS
jgi:hypothetical protein